MSAWQSFQRLGVGGLLALVGCASTPHDRSRSEVVSLGTVLVQPASSAEWAGGKATPTHEDAGVAQRELEMPSLEMPSGLTENGRDQYGALLAVMLTLIGEVVEARQRIPLDCSPALDSCRSRWEGLSASLRHVVETLNTPWFDCHGLDAVDARAFIDTSKKFKLYVVARLSRIEADVDSLIRDHKWGAAAARAWRALSVAQALDAVQPPTCQ
jgi:hypothetical protein